MRRDCPPPEPDAGSSCDSRQVFTTDIHLSKMSWPLDPDANVATPHSATNDPAAWEINEEGPGSAPPDIIAVTVTI